MDSLIEQLNKALSESYILSHKAHAFHWNVVDPLFPMYHSFFGDFYEEVYGAVDKTAEEIRALDAFPVTSFASMITMSSVKEFNGGTMPVHMFIAALREDNDLITSSWNKAFNLATSANQQGLANFAAERIDAHKKHAWMLRSMTSQVRSSNESVQQESKTYEITFNK